MAREWKTRRRKVIKSQSIMNCLLNSNSLLLHLLQIWAAGWVLPIWPSPESFGLNPHWLIRPELLFFFFFVRSERQVGTGDWKGIWPLCHVGPPSSLTSYGRATWVGNECTRLEKEKKKKMLVPQEGKGDKVGRDLGVGEVTWKGEESN